MGRTIKRNPRVREILLFGPQSCRIGGCCGDGNYAVDMPGVRYDMRTAEEGSVGAIETWVTIYMCEKHAAERTIK